MPQSLSRRSTLLRISAISLANWFPLALFANNASTLNALPRVALVVGNSRYSDLPPLKNPANDAAALSARLGDMGFAVIPHLDTGKAAFESAVAEFCTRIARNKSVGLFYFAGHGLQLNWRNYLVPVDAKLDKADDVPRHAVDLTMVLDGLRRAANPMNIVILDACRDNPFALDLRTGKGLSQMDAPVGTLLAYATAPGNTASDGEGENGLYTEHLLKEIRAPEARIEDVFKRVRLNVRRASNGRQIPWESTSLEDDFYFLPPAQIRKVSKEEIDRQYAEELAAWQKVEAIAGLEDYLRRYPSGHFAELAQVRLDRLLAQKGEQKASVVSSPANPFSKGSAPANTAYRVGEVYEYRTIDLYTKKERATSRLVVTAVSDAGVVFNDGRSITDLLGNGSLNAQGMRQADNQTFPAEYAIGKKWVTRHTQTQRGFSEELHIDYAVVGREVVEVPAGRFDAFRIEGSGFGMTTGRKEIKYWVAPDRMRRIVLRENRFWDTRYNKNAAPDQFRIELVSFTPAP